MVSLIWPAKQRWTNRLTRTALRPADKRRTADEDSDGGEWRAPAAHALAGPRAGADALPLFVPAAQRLAALSPPPPPPRAATSEPLAALPLTLAHTEADVASARRPAHSAPAALGTAAPMLPAFVHMATPASSAPGSDRCPLSRRRGAGLGVEACSGPGGACAPAARPKRQAAAAAEAAAREARFYDFNLEADEEEEEEVGAPLHALALGSAHPKPCPVSTLTLVSCQPAAAGAAGRAAACY